MERVEEQENFFIKCRCEDIAKCSRDIIKLQSALEQISQIRSSMVSIEATAQQLDRYEPRTYLWDKGTIRSSTGSSWSTNRQLIHSQVDSGAGKISIALEQLQQELISLQQEDTAYHEEERRHQKEEASTEEDL